MTSATKDLDIKLENALSSLTLDTEGLLVRPLSLKAAFKVFDRTFHLFLSEWMENCNVFGRCKHPISSGVSLALILIIRLSFSQSIGACMVRFCRCP